MGTTPLLAYPVFGASKKDREPLLEFMCRALHDQGCRILFCSLSSEAPFRITFETRNGERMGIVAYAFLANSRTTLNRPADEHRFQLKYGSKDGQMHELWQDPNRLYTTLLIGINPEQGFFVGADPVLHSPTRFFISVEFKQHHVEEILKSGWHVWERERRGSRLGKPVEVLVGGTAEHFLDYIRFERGALGEDQGHRQVLAEKALEDGPTLHALARELALSEKEVLDLIESAGRLKVAVRGWVAEEHLARFLKGIPEVQHCTRLAGDGPDLAVTVAGRQLMVECKNVLRRADGRGAPRLDFQRTRAAKSDPCSRYYSSMDFDIVAACLHPVTEQWEFRFALTAGLKAHASCPGKLSSNVRIDAGWLSDPMPVFHSLVRK